METGAPSTLKMPAMPHTAPDRTRLRAHDPFAVGCLQTFPDRPCDAAPRLAAMTHVLVTGAAGLLDVPVPCARGSRGALHRPRA